MTLQEAKQKVASNHGYVDWYQLRAHCKGFEGDVDPRMLTYSDEAAEIYCASQVAELTKENELLTRENWEMKRWSVHEELSRLREERKNQADKYNDLRNLIQRFHQTLIARNYNNIGKWHNERQEYNYELISEVEAILTSKS